MHTTKTNKYRINMRNSLFQYILESRLEDSIVGRSSEPEVSNSTDASHVLPEAGSEGPDEIGVVRD